MAHRVKCYYCAHTFDRDKEPFVEVSKKRYAHKSCFDAAQKTGDQELQDKLELEKYIMKMFKMDYVDPRVQKQMQNFHDNMNYTYSGMRKALIYFYEIKGNSLEKANGGIGIIPYIYKNAHDYYYALWQAQQKNETKVIEHYVPVVKEIVIPNPQRNIKKRKLFTFLDEEEV